MYKDKVGLFHRLQDIVDQLNPLLDRALKKYEDEKADEIDVEEITNLISKAHKVQLEILGCCPEK